MVPLSIFSSILQNFYFDKYQARNTADIGMIRDSMNLKLAFIFLTYI